MIALREFRYYDHAAKRSVAVPVGAELNVSALRANQVDVDKLARTKIAGQAEGVVITPKRKRGRPRKEG